MLYVISAQGTVASPYASSVTVKSTAYTAATLSVYYLILLMNSRKSSLNKQKQFARVLYCTTYTTRTPERKQAEVGHKEDKVTNRELTVSTIEASMSTYRLPLTYLSDARTGSRTSQILDLLRATSSY